MAERVGAEDEFLLPVGTVTLLLADVEGSTQLWQADAAAMAPAMTGLDDVVNEAIGRHDGVRPIEQGEGDSFVAAFARASDAVAAALEIQGANRGPALLRIGVHTGEVQLRGTRNYVGLPINRCARLRDLGHGGQILLSETTRDLVLDEFPGDAWLVDLGVHRLRDLSRPEHVWQLCGAGMKTEFPALRSLDVRPHNLPVELTTFIGRDAELADVLGLLREARLLTLTGSGGCGKTRLALHVAAAIVSQFVDGVWLVELASAADESAVEAAVAHALGVRDDAVRPAMEAIVDHLADRNALLLLDNCEHVVGACADLCDRVLRASPGVAVLATSREPLGMPAELVWRVPSLSLPSDRDVEPISALSRSDAVSLFVERAKRVAPGFELTDAIAPSVADICRRLDGIPLAIELAASRVKVFGADQIAQRLHDRFHFLTGGARASLPRQQTLQASIDWSHQLLTEPEQILFRRLGVFPASFDFDAVERVGVGGVLEQHQLLDLLSLLVDKSLVDTVDHQGGTRYRLLESVREYAARELDVSGETETVQGRHRDHYLAVAMNTFFALTVSDPSWTRQMDEVDNARLAFHVSRASGDTTKALQIAAFMFPTWIQRGRAQEGRSWTEAALADAGDIPPRLRAFALSNSALLAADIGADGRADGDEAVRIARHLGDDQFLSYVLCGAAWAHSMSLSEHAVTMFREALERTGDIEVQRLTALTGLGIALSIRGDVFAALPILEQARELEMSIGVGLKASMALAELLVHQGELQRALLLARELAEGTSDPQVEQRAVACTAEVLARMGDSAGALDRADDAMTIAHRLSNAQAERLAWGARGIAHLAGGDAKRAAEAFHAATLVSAGGVLGVAGAWAGLAEADLALGNVEEALHHAAQLDEFDGRRGHLMPAVTASVVRANAALDRDDAREAERHGHLALQGAVRVASTTGVAGALEILAAAAHQLESDREAARLLAAAASMRAGCGSVRFRIHDAGYASLLAAVRDALGDEFDATWSEGAALTMDEAIAYAVRGRGERKRPATGWASLTPAERNVANLVSQGLDNNEVAERLFVSVRTVQSHLTRIYTKLGITSRVKLANEAARHR